MERENLTSRLIKLEKRYRSFVEKKHFDIKSIHKLRVQTREVLSCINKEDHFYEKLRRVLKLTNEIRDIDVFENEFLKNLPIDLKDQINLSLISSSLKETRDKDCINLLQYLSQLQIPKVVIPKLVDDKKITEPSNRVELVNYSYKELHKYRIFIKKELYFYKVFYPQKEKRIQKLTKIKDYLGLINDNYNAKKRIKSYMKIDKKLLSYIKKENKSYLEKVVKLNTTLKL